MQVEWASTEIYFVFVRENILIGSFVPLSNAIALPPSITLLISGTEHLSFTQFCPFFLSFARNNWQFVSAATIEIASLSCSVAVYGVASWKSIIQSNNLKEISTKRKFHPTTVHQQIANTSTDRSENKLVSQILWQSAYTLVGRRETLSGRLKEFSTFWKKKYPRNKRYLFGG